MTIRCRLLLSYVGLVIIFTIGLVFIVDRFAIDRLTGAVIKETDQSLDRLAAANTETAREILTRYGEELVAAHARAVANEAARALSGRTDLDDYPSLRRDGKLRRVAIQDIVVRGSIVGYTCLIDLKGNSVIHSQRELVEQRGYRIYRESYPTLWNLVERSFTEPRVSGYYRFLDKETSRARDKYMVIERVPGHPFSIAAMVFIDDFFQAMAEEVSAATRREKVGAKVQVEGAIGRSGEAVKSLGLLLAATLLLAGSAFALWFAHSLSKPIIRLRDAVAGVGRGGLLLPAPQEGPVETRDLARAFNRLGSDLAGYVEHLKIETRAREAMESEIRLAGEVQRSLLPRPDAPCLVRPEYTLHAALKPAHECSGDFYDFFPVDEETLAIAVGDVSGKGMPAALFTAMTLTLLRSHGAQDRDPGRVLRMVNEAIRRENEAGMFVTIFFGYYSVATGRLVYANAGHHAALLLRPDGGIIPFGLLRDPAAGFGEVPLFHKGEARIAPGEKIFLYTDGVDEAQRPDGELFGSGRLQELLRELNNLAPAALTHDLLDTLVSFQNGSVYDDITLLILERRHGEKPRRN